MRKKIRLLFFLQYHNIPYLNKLFVNESKYLSGRQLLCDFVELLATEKQAKRIIVERRAKDCKRGPTFSIIAR